MLVHKHNVGIRGIVGKNDPCIKCQILVEQIKRIHKFGHDEKTFIIICKFLHKYYNEYELSSNSTTKIIYFSVEYLKMVVGNRK